MDKTKLFISRFMMITIFILNQGCFGSDKQDLPNDIKWVRSSVEYQAICIQVYRGAWVAIKDADQQLNEHWAVILDVDETVLDNSRYEAMIARKGLKYPAGWTEWVLSAEAEAVPGAKAFLDSVRTLGENAHVVYITNRDTAFEEATIANLKSLDMWQADDLMLCRRDKSDTKADRRHEVVTGAGRCEGRGQRIIIALIGDKIDDVVDYKKGAHPDSLRIQFKDDIIWGNTAFILPNPMYGDWVNDYQ